MSVKRPFGTEAPRAIRKGVRDHITFGDEHAGFEATLDKPHRLVRLRLWGHWTMPIAEEFSSTVFRFADELKGHKWSILTDSRKFGAQAPTVAQLRQQMMARVHTQGCVKIAAIAPQQAVYAMQFRRISDESHMESGIFYDETSALAWLSDEEEPFPR
jgi:hypothetical protein